MESTRTGSGRWWKLLLLAFGVVMVSTLASGVWNMRHPLTHDQLQAARLLWKQHEPPVYSITYVTRTQDTPGGDRFIVQVKNGKPIEATCNGRAEPRERLPYYGMERLYDFIDEFYQLDKKAKEKGSRPFYRGTFDPQTGALRWFARRILGERQWVEITVEKVE